MKKYQIIYADPPWSFNNKNTGGSMKSGSNAHYKTMNIDELCELPINNLADENCVLFMWWVGTLSKEAIQLVESWGFTIKTMTAFNWVKTTKNDKLHFGMGFWTRAGSENCLIAIKGKPKRVNACIRSVVMTQILKHSEKPNIFRKEIIKLMGDLPRIELFAREKFEGWDCMGDEIENSIDLEKYKNNETY